MRRAKRPKRASSARLNLRIKQELRDKMHSYAARCGTTVTAIVVRHFIQLLAAERTEQEEAEQL